MSNGDFHEAVNSLTLTSFSFYLISIGLPPVECVLFWLHGMIHTYYVTPDLDTHSKSTKRLGIIGKIIDYIFPHRGPLHNVLLWAVGYFLIGLGIWIQYHYIAWFLCGGVLAILMHIFVDGISTRKRRFWGKMKKKLNPFNWI